MKSVKTGTILRNGATVVASKPHRYYEGCSVVLALWDEKLVTWAVNHEDLSASLGHYFHPNHDNTDAAAAFADFEKR